MSEMDTPEQIDMPPFPASFRRRGGWLVNRLMQEFSISRIAAAAIVGNLGYESAGFEVLQERGIEAPYGGYGWAQWTGPRRRQYEAFCRAWRLAPSSDTANFNFLCAELAGPYNGMLGDLDSFKEQGDLGQAVMTVGQQYERPAGTTPTHLPGYGGRLSYAELALEGSVNPDGPQQPPDGPMAA